MRRVAQIDLAKCDGRRTGQLQRADVCVSDSRMSAAATRCTGAI